MYNITGYKHHLCIWYIYTRLWYLSIRCFFQKDRNLKHWLQASHSLQERASKMLKQQGRIHESLVANKSRMKGYTVHQTFQISSSVVLGNHPVDILCGLASNLIFWKWEKFFRMNPLVGLQRFLLCDFFNIFSASAVSSSCDMLAALAPLLFVHLAWTICFICWRDRISSSKEMSS